MTQLFGRRASAAFRVAIIGVPLALAAIFVGLNLYARSDQAWGVGQPAPQPIPFRHDVHAGGLGIDCRYCHSSVERAAAAGMPSAQTCLTCHSQVWAGTSTLEPVRTSMALNVPVPWQSVHKLPDFIAFHHGVHVQNGVACETCHGRVDRMQRTVKTETLNMGWCLDCHRDPAPRLRPSETVFATGWHPGVSPARQTAAAEPVAALDRLTDCSTCHR